jgi:hypothetical protein
MPKFLFEIKKTEGDAKGELVLTDHNFVRALELFLNELIPEENYDDLEEIKITKKEVAKTPEKTIWGVSKGRAEWPV